MKTIIGWVAAAAVLVFVLGVGVMAGIAIDRRFGQVVGASGEPASGLDNALIQQAFDFVDENFVDQSAVDPTQLTYGAIAGMVEALGDTGHTRFMSPEMVTSEQKALQGEFDGIGALVEMRDGYPTIVAPYDGSPAQQAGLKPGDIILAVDGEETFGKTLQEVVSGITGEAGTTVTLTIQEPDTGLSRQVTLTRERIQIQNVSWTMLPGTRVALIRLAQFSRDVSDDLIDALRAAQDEGAEAIIFDLRNNPGGLLDEAIRVASQFLRPGQDVLQVRDAEGVVETLEVERGGIAREIPMVVLINQGSASAAEIVSGAIQDYERATLVGETTFGTGTVLNQFNLDDGSALLLAVQEWLTPNGRVIWHEGIAPDETVSLEDTARPLVPWSAAELSADDLRRSDDAQLLRALELLEQGN